MLTLPLDPTDDRAKPAFRDVTSCTQWLGQLQFTNLQQAHATVRGQMEELNHCPMRGAERMNVLELMRDTVSYVQTNYRKKLIGKKLPLTEDELTIFISIVNLWQIMVAGYQRCLQSLLAGDSQLAAHGALLCQRGLLYSGQQIFEYLRTGYEFDGRLWQQLHELYAYSEEQGFQHDKIKGNPNEVDDALSCQAIYIKALLACYAHPMELSRSQLKLLNCWLSTWSEVITLEHSYASSKGDAPPLAVDLASSQGLLPINLISELPERAGSAKSNRRYLAMLPLSKLMRVKTILLQQGQTPQQLALDEKAGREECEDLLSFLHQCWCEGLGDRLVERQTVERQARVCYGLESIYAHIANKAFKLRGREGGVDSMERQQIATFGRVLSEDNRLTLADMGFALESWQVENESMLGAHLLREKSAGIRISPNQIVAVRLAEAGFFMLGAISWAHVTQAGLLTMGVRFLPGVAQAITINGTGINSATADKSEAALLLPALPSLKTPASLLLPCDWFLPGRQIEIVLKDNVKKKVKLGLSIEKGVDFERVSFVPV